MKERLRLRAGGTIRGRRKIPSIKVFPSGKSVIEIFDGEIENIGRELALSFPTVIARELKPSQII